MEVCFADKIVEMSYTSQIFFVELVVISDRLV